MRAIVLVPADFRSALGTKTADSAFLEAVEDMLPPSHENEVSVVTLDDENFGEAEFHFEGVRWRDTLVWVLHQFRTRNEVDV